jgi:hypothetical protein
MFDGGQKAGNHYRFFGTISRLARFRLGVV